MSKPVNIQQMYTSSVDTNRPITGTDNSRRYALKFPEGLPVYKLQIKATNIFDIIPFRITNPQHPLVKAGHIKPDGAYTDDIFMYWEHTNYDKIGNSALCMKRMFGEPCFVCDEQAEMANMKANGWKDDDVKSLFPRSRVIMNVIDWRNREAGIQVLTGSDYVLRQGILSGARVVRDDEYSKNAKFADTAETFELETSDWKTKTSSIDEYLYFASPTNGFGVSIETDRGIIGDGHEYAKPSSFVMMQREQQYTADIVDSAYDLVELLNIPDYDELREAMHGKTNVAPVENTVATPAHDAVTAAVPPPAPAPQAANTVEAELPPQAVGVPAPGPIKTAVAETGEQINAVPDATPRCSYGHVFGDDYDTKPECSECQANEKDQYIKCLKIANGMEL